MRQQWPLGTFLELGPYPGAVPCARLHARVVTAEWGLQRLRATTELLVSELVTNAVQASRGLGGQPPVRLWLRSDGMRVLVMVGDASPQPPARVRPAADDENGRGLLLVDSLAERWGWHPEADGKVCWCVVAGEGLLTTGRGEGMDSEGTGGRQDGAGQLPCRAAGRTAPVWYRLGREPVRPELLARVLAALRHSPPTGRPGRPARNPSH